MTKRKGLNSIDFNNRNSGVKPQRDLWDDKVRDFTVVGGKKVSSSTPSKYDDIWNDGVYGSKGSYSKGGVSTYSSKPYERCYHKHPTLKIPGTEWEINGGSCSSPVCKDADVYIGFDQSMSFTQRNWPWKKGAEVLFYVQDMSVPASPEEFKKLIAWTHKQLQDGKKIHAGCIGGHGRTGMFLAALIKTIAGEEDAIAYVRKNYCVKAVESASQVDFLHKEFGIKKVAGTKSHSSGKSGAGAYKAPTSSSSGIENLTPLRGKGTIWDEPAAVR
jgi:hypothetical protein